MSGRPKMCPSCGKLMGTGNQCPYCGADARSISSRMKAASRAVSGATDSGGTPVTFVLMVLMFGIYLAAIAFGGIEDNGGGLFGLFAPKHELQVMLGSMRADLVRDGEWWRLVTAIFLHGGIIHLMMNGLFLWWLGRDYENEVGSAQFLTLFIVAGIVGFIASFELGSGHSLGASGGGFGLVGAIIGRRRMLDGHFRDPRTFRAIELAALNLILGFIMTRIDNFAHIGGLVAGLGLGFVQARFTSTRIWLTTAVLFGALAIASGALALVNRVDPNASIKVVECIVDSGKAIDQASGAIYLTEAKGMLACLDSVTPPTSANDGYEQMRNGLRMAIEGREKGSFSNEREGINQFLRGQQRYLVWFSDRFERSMPGS